MSCNNSNRVYVHRKPNGEVFYVGISNNGKRPYSNEGRSKYWHRIVNKYGYTIEIMCKNLTRHEANEIEIYLIYYYGRKDLNTGSLVNMTKGGDGCVGKIVSRETRLKQSNSKLGDKNPKTKSKKVIDTSTGEIYNTALTPTQVAAL